MHVKGQFFGSCALYLSFGTCYEVNIMQLCSFSMQIIEYVNITTPGCFCTMNKKCKFLSMGYISAMTQASVLIGSENVRLRFKGFAIDTNKISYAVRNGLGGKAQLVRNLPCM